MELESHYEEDPHNYKTTGVAARVGDLHGLQRMIWDGRPVDVFDNRGWSPLHEAAFKGFSGCLEFLLRQPECDPDWQNHERETPLLIAARYSHIFCVRNLINARADVNLPSAFGVTALYEAVQARNNECVRLLIKKGADVNCTLCRGYTPLHQAASMGDVHITNMLLSNGARQDVRELDNGLTPLFLAVQSGDIDTVRCLLRDASASDDIDLETLVNTPANDNATPLLIAAQEGFDRILELLLHRGADANITITENKAGPLQYAVFKCRPRCVQRLLSETSLSVFEMDYGHMHPLVQALRHQSVNILQLLLDAGLNAIDTRPLDHTQADEVDEMLDDLPSLGSKACLLCHVQREVPLTATEHLLNLGLSPDGAGQIPPLIMAMIRHHMPLFTLLLRRGAKPNRYPAHIKGNLMTLYALAFDLRRHTALPANLLNRASAADVKLTSLDNGKHVVGACGDGSTQAILTPPQEDGELDSAFAWLDQRQDSYILSLIAAGGEVESLLRNAHVCSSVGSRAYGLPNMLKGYVDILIRGEGRSEEELVKDRQAMASAVLTLLLCFSTFVSASLAQSLLDMVSVDQAKELNSLAEKTNSLAHMMRVRVVKCLLRREGRFADLVAALRLPHTMSQFLLFPELTPHARILGSLKAHAKRQMAPEPEPLSPELDMDE